MIDFKPGQRVKINPYVYDSEWDGWKELYKKFWHYELTVDRLVDLTDINEGIWVIVSRYGTDKTKVRPEYLWDIECFYKK